MTDVVNISPGRDIDPQETSRGFRYSGHVPGWIAPPDQTLLADIVSALSAGPYNAFAESHSGSSHDLTVETGEAVVGGVLLARDTTTPVTLPSNTTGITVSVGWVSGTTDAVKIDRNANFGSNEPHIGIYIVDTDGSGISNVEDIRDLGQQVTVQNTRYESGGSGVQVDDAAHADQADTAAHADNADQIEGRDIYVSSSEPSGWDDGDIWFKPT